MSNTSDTYNDKYFEWQKKIGEFGGKANLFKFKDYIAPTDTVLDFGCGGGYLLQNINAGQKIGVEINISARVKAMENGVNCYSNLSEIPDDSVDAIISNHALEHVVNPADVLIEFKRVLRDRGIIVVVVPRESSSVVDMNDRNMHLYTWTPQTLVNLFRVCGIDIVEHSSICHMWPLHYQKIQRLVGWNIFHKICWLYCKIKGTGYQTRVIGVVRKGERYEERQNN